MTVSKIINRQISIRNAADHQMSVTKKDGGGLLIQINHAWPGEGKENDFRGSASFTVSPDDTKTLLYFLTGIGQLDPEEEKSLGFEECKA
jgi:hypothetical protein